MSFLKGGAGPGLSMHPESSMLSTASTASTASTIIHASLEVSRFLLRPVYNLRHTAYGIRSGGFIAKF